MAEQTLPPWFTELSAEAQREISDYLKQQRLKVSDLEAKLKQQGADHLRITEHRNADIIRLEGEVTRLQAELAKRPQIPRPMQELLNELGDWYAAADLFLFRVKAIGEKYLPSEEDHTHD